MNLRVKITCVCGCSFEIGKWTDDRTIKIVCPSCLVPLDDVSASGIFGLFEAFKELSLRSENPMSRIAKLSIRPKPKNQN